MTADVGRFEQHPSSSTTWTVNSAGEPGSDGEPSTNDLQTLDLIRIVEQFATGFDSLPELIPGVGSPFD